ncbi:MAG: hypothetical protein AABN33_29830 [Acidobacteriota bacterium]
MKGNQEVVVKLTEEQREQIRKATGKNIGSVLLIEMVYSEPPPDCRGPQSSQTHLTTISST